MASRNYTPGINKPYLQKLIADKMFWMNYSSNHNDLSSSVINLQIDIINKKIKSHKEVASSLGSPSIIGLNGIFAFIGIRYQMQFLNDADKGEYSKASREFYKIITQDSKYDWVFVERLALPAH